jgi:hypothetical protein
MLIHLWRRLDLVVQSDRGLQVRSIEEYSLLVVERALVASEMSPDFGLSVTGRWLVLLYHFTLS